MRLISQCLDERLTAIFAQVKKITELDNKIKQYLPENLVTHCKVGNYIKGNLLLVTNAVWATELRYCLPMLRESLRKKAKLYDLVNIKIIISNDATYIPPKIKEKEEVFSQDLQDLFYQAAEQNPNVALKEVLYKLAKRSTFSNTGA